MAKMENKGGAPKGMKTSKPTPISGSAAKIKAEAKQVMTAKQWEKSATDAAMDRKVAKQQGIPVKQYEGSALDMRNDKTQRAQHNERARALIKKGK